MFHAWFLQELIALVNYHEQYPLQKFLSNKPRAQPYNPEGKSIFFYFDENHVEYFRAIGQEDRLLSLFDTHDPSSDCVLHDFNMDEKVYQFAERFLDKCVDSMLTNSPFIMWLDRKYKLYLDEGLYGENKLTLIILPSLRFEDLPVNSIYIMYQSKIDPILAKYRVMMKAYEEFLRSTKSTTILS